AVLFARLGCLRGCVSVCCAASNNCPRNLFPSAVFIHSVDANFQHCRRNNVWLAAALACGELPRRRGPAANSVRRIRGARRGSRLGLSLDANRAYLSDGAVFVFRRYHYNELAAILGFYYYFC